MAVTQFEKSDVSLSLVEGDLYCNLNSVSTTLSADKGRLNPDKKSGQALTIIQIESLSF